MINLHEMYEKSYKIGFDPTVLAYPELKKDPDYRIIPCRFGEIYSYSSELLAVWVNGNKRIQRMKREIPELIFKNNGDGEAVFLFHPELFKKIAKFVKPFRKRHLSPETKEKLLNASMSTRFKPKNTVQKPTSENSER